MKHYCAKLGLFEESWVALLGMIKALSGDTNFMKASTIPFATLPSRG